jgi:hypothetical protein
MRACCVRSGRRSARGRAAFGWVVSRNGLSDHTRPHHRVVVGPRPHQIDCVVVGARRRDLLTWPAVSWLVTAGLLVGFRIPDHVAARRGGSRHGVAIRARACERGDRASGQPRRHLVGNAGRDGRAGHQLRSGPQQRRHGLGSRSHCSSRGRGFLPSATSSQQPAVRLTRGCPPHFFG